MVKAYLVGGLWFAPTVLPDYMKKHRKRPKCIYLITEQGVRSWLLTIVTKPVGVGERI